MFQGQPFSALSARVSAMHSRCTRKVCHGDVVSSWALLCMGAGLPMALQGRCYDPIAGPRPCPGSYQQRTLGHEACTSPLPGERPATMLPLSLFVLALCITSSGASPYHKRVCLKEVSSPTTTPNSVTSPAPKAKTAIGTAAASDSSTTAAAFPPPRPSPVEDKFKSDVKAPKPTSPAPAPGFSLRSSYINVKFGQSKAEVDASVKGSFDRLLSTVKDGAFDDVAGWTAQNGWTVIAQYDAVHKSRTFEKQVSSAQSHLKDHSQTECNWQKPFVNCYNDDNGWAALALIQAYESYGDNKYLELAKGIFEVSDIHWIPGRDES